MVFDRDVLAFDIADFPEARAERAQIMVERSRGDKPDDRCRRLPRARRGRPCRRDPR
jgi:hypothetical protein